MITHEIVEVTPEMATEFLSKNMNNRRVISSAVEQYADAMRRGLWKFDGAPWRIDTEGVLLDGQHRALAIIQSETTQTVLIVKGIEPEAQFSMDTGRKRSLADALSMEGESNTANLAALVTVAYRYTKGARGHSLWFGATLSTPEGKSLKEILQIGDLLEFFKQHEELRDIVREAEHIRRGTSILTTRVVGLGMWLFGKLDDADTEYFFDKLVTGTDLESGSPVHALRQTLYRMERNGTVRPVPHHYALMVKAWNLYRDGSTSQILTFKSGGATPETYPTPR